MLDQIFPLIYDHAVNRLLLGLPEELPYHNLYHILDVLKQAQRIAKDENIKNEEDVLSLKTAALYHDAGFIYKYTGHEEAGCQLARKELPGFGMNEQQVGRICGMIMATKLPQSPKNKLEEIICDADLDYLGRPDFFTIGDALFSEKKEKGLVSNKKQWNLIQIRFIKEHQYFTASNKRTREKQKKKHLELLEAGI